ncbi:hypothetical protein HDA40_001913 [Hamadaea flava]|uniref:Uncharacterized protein n=1 Tax=Hamadaea flava TaxID=1742688 RepID=A0ABV8LE65_9ACTN|nr:hypothetical protein [Hamadaea flava]MCP2323406.1 hypothetical protein [Hamadaea flava]
MVQARRNESAPIPTGDVIPGDPPVPITVWHEAREPSGELVSFSLAHRLIINMTHRGQLIIDMTEGTQLARAVLMTGRHSTLHAPTALSTGAEHAALIVTGWPVTDVDARDFFDVADDRLLPGGCVVVVLPHADPAGYAEIVRAAHDVGLRYLQHIVVAHQLDSAGQSLQDDGRHLRIHTDLLLLTAEREQDRDG